MLQQSLLTTLLMGLTDGDQRIPKLRIQGITSDSRHVRKGDLFIALRGKVSHGLDYWDELRDKGLAAIIWEPPYNGHALSRMKDARGIFGDDNSVSEEDRETSARIIAVPHLSLRLSTIAARFYRDAFSSLKLVGVTGTEGKTSVTHFVAQALELLGQPCGLVGTNGIGRLGTLSDNSHTTPDYLNLRRALADMAVLWEEQLDPQQPSSLSFPVAMEITSHALHQGRTEGLDFRVTALTGLTRDHLDYHGTLEEYAAAKSRLFLDYASSFRVLNLDDALGASLAQRLIGHAGVIGYGQNSSKINVPMLHISDLNQYPKGFWFRLVSPWGSAMITSTLLGAFNAKNLVCTAGILLGLGVSFEDIVGVLPRLTTVEGRMQTLSDENAPTVVLDYAHKPYALEQVLVALRHHLHGGRLICVFGCGGDRDMGKRPIMGEIAERLADICIVTNDNPRHESPLDIAKAILQGCANPSAIKVELDRRAAITYALSVAKMGDIVLIAGKGHEKYQQIGLKRTPFDDALEVRMALKALSCT